MIKDKKINWRYIKILPRLKKIYRLWNIPKTIYFLEYLWIRKRNTKRNYIRNKERKICRLPNIREYSKDDILFLEYLWIRKRNTKRNYIRNKERKICRLPNIREYSENDIFFRIFMDKKKKNKKKLYQK